jgi:hypothetical protein
MKSVVTFRLSYIPCFSVSDNIEKTRTELHYREDSREPNTKVSSVMRFVIELWLGIYETQYLLPHVSSNACELTELKQEQYEHK